MDATEWIVVANATQARIFERTDGGPLRLVHAFEHPRSRQRSAQLGRDKSGREARDGKAGGPAYQPRTDPHRKEHVHFALELGAYLEDSARNAAFGSIAIFAPDPFLGQLRAALGDACRKRLRLSSGPDLSHVGIAELPRRIGAALQGVPLYVEDGA